MEKYKMQEVKDRQGCFTGGSITRIGEIVTTDEQRRFITDSVSELVGQEVEFIGTASIKKSGAVTLVLI